MDTGNPGTPVGVDLPGITDDDIPDEIPELPDFDDGSGPITGDEQVQPEEELVT